MLRKYPEHCTILGTIPQASVTYRRQDLGLETMQALQLLNGIFKVVIWNKEAQHMLFDQNPRWCAALSNAMPEAISSPAHIHPLRMWQK